MTFKMHLFIFYMLHILLGVGWGMGDGGGWYWVGAWINKASYVKKNLFCIRFFWQTINKAVHVSVIWSFIMKYCINQPIE